MRVIGVIQDYYNNDRNYLYYELSFLVAVRKYILIYDE